MRRVLEEPHLEDEVEGVHLSRICDGPQRRMAVLSGLCSIPPSLEGQQMPQGIAEERHRSDPWSVPVRAQGIG